MGGGDLPGCDREVPTPEPPALTYQERIDQVERELSAARGFDLSDQAIELGIEGALRPLEERIARAMEDRLDDSV